MRTFMLVLSLVLSAESFARVNMEEIKLTSKQLNCLIKGTCSTEEAGTILQKNSDLIKTAYAEPSVGETLFHICNTSDACGIPACSRIPRCVGTGR